MLTTVSTPALDSTAESTSNSARASARKEIQMIVPNETYALRPVSRKTEVVPSRRRSSAGGTDRKYATGSNSGRNSGSRNWGGSQ
jgi:hypothetical protein